MMSSSLVRALGPAAAALLPDMPNRPLAQAGAMMASDVASRRLAPPGFQFLEIAPEKGKSFSVPQQIGAEAAGAAGYAAAGSLVLLGVERLPVPRPVRAALVGALFAVADLRLHAYAARARAAAAAKAASVPAEAAAG